MSDPPTFSRRAANKRVAEFIRTVGRFVSQGIGTTGLKTVHQGIHQVS